MKNKNSNLKKLQKYFIAGIDFLIDKEGNIYFIEANSNPGLIRFLEKEYGKCKPINKILEIFNKENFLFIHTKKTFYQPDTKYKIKKLIKNKKDGIEIIENLEKTKIEKMVKKILEEKKDKIIDTPFLKIKEEFFKNNYQSIINPYLVTNLTINKFTLYTKLKPTKNFKIPLSFDFKTKKDLIRLIKEKKLKKIIIKPQFGQKGENIFIIDDLKQIKNIKLKKDNWIVQEKIEVNKIKNKYYDIRAFAIDGKFSDCVARISKNPIVNISLEGKTLAVDNKTKIKIKKATEDIIKQINKLLKEQKI